MRIVSGIYGGRRLMSPKDKSIRPTSDKVRGSLMNALGSMGAIEGASVLDGFCGTGALGLEALSRGARRCTFVDAGKSSLDLARQNAQLLGLKDEARFILSDLCKARLDEAFDLVFLDPPYKKDLAMPALSYLEGRGALAKNCVIVLETEVGFDPELSGAFSVQRHKVYGDIQTIILQKD